MQLDTDFEAKEIHTLQKGIDALLSAYEFGAHFGMRRNNLSFTMVRTCLQRVVLLG